MALYRFILGFILCSLSMAWGSTINSRLEVCFFHTGQGNCIAVRADSVDSSCPGGIDSRLIFVDCGGGAIVKNGYRDDLLDQQEYPGKKLGSLFRGISSCEVLITHNHGDHTNLLQTLVQVGEENGYFAIPSPIKPMSKKEFLKGQNGLTEEDFLQKDWDHFCINDLPRIENALGPRVRIVPMRPERWNDNGAANPEHDFNMLYLVEFAGRRILFPGDVSPQLFTQIMNIPRYNREIKATDFCVSSHHGTNRAGEVLIHHAIKPEMCIICSNPEEGDALPWKEVGGLVFKNRSDGVTLKEHGISTNGEPQSKILPLFVTSDAAQGYYELVIEADGTAKLFDGPTARKDNDCCFSSH
jgi:metal-dependent hydrolase (beta-lactamase superfamily II)